MLEAGREVPFTALLCFLLLAVLAKCQIPAELPVAEAVTKAIDNEDPETSQTLIEDAARVIVQHVADGDSFMVGASIGFVLNPKRTGVPHTNFVPHIGPKAASVMAQIFALAINTGIEDGDSSGATANGIALSIAGGFEHALFSCEFSIQNGGTTLPPTTDLVQLIATKCCPIINKPMKGIVKDDSFKSNEAVSTTFKDALVEERGIGHPNIDVSLCDPFGKKDADGSRIKSILRKRDR